MSNNYKNESKRETFLTEEFKPVKKNRKDRNDKYKNAIYDDLYSLSTAYQSKSRSNKIRQI